MPLSPRLRYKLDRILAKVKGLFEGRESQPRPKLCPSCGTLVGAGATRCHQCGASMTFSMAAASRSIGRLLPATSPATYAILGLSCIIYIVSLLWTMRLGALSQIGGGISGLFNFGGIDGRVLARLGESAPLPYNLMQPWRFVMAIFLHGSLMHIGFNMWVLMDIGPQIEELYGSARYFFIYIVTGIGGYLLSSSISGIPSVGGSGAILGLIGVLLAITMGKKSAGMQMLRGHLVRWLIYIFVLGFLFRGSIDNYAHLGGLATGFLLGKIMTDRAPMSSEERKRAYLLGWSATLLTLASFLAMIYVNFHSS